MLSNVRSSYLLLRIIQRRSRPQSFQNNICAYIHTYNNKNNNNIKSNNNNNNNNNSNNNNSNNNNNNNNNNINVRYKTYQYAL